MATSTENIVLTFDIEATKGAKSIRMMRQEMKDLQVQMEQASEAGDKVTFDKLKKNYGELKNDMRDFREEMNAMDKGEVLGNTIKMVQGAVGAFGALTASASLFGVENTKLQEIEKKSMQIIQLMIGLEEARKLLIDQGAIARNKATLETAKNTVVEWANSVSKNASARAEAAKTATMNAGNIATKAVTAVQWAWNAALAANPIGLVIAGVVALTGAIAGLVYVFKEEEVAQENLNKTYLKYNESVDNRIKLMQKYGATEIEVQNEIIKNSTELNKVNQKKLDQAFEIFMNSSDQNEIDKAGLRIAELKNQILVEENKITDANIIISKEKNKILKDQTTETNKYTEAQKQANEQLAKEKKDANDKYYADLIKGMQDANEQIDEADAIKTEAINQRNKEVSDTRIADAEFEKQYFIELENEKAMREYENAEKSKQLAFDTLQYKRSLNASELELAGQLTDGIISLLGKDEEARKRNAVAIKALALAGVGADLGKAMLNNLITASAPNAQNVATSGIFGLTMLQVLNAQALITAGLATTNILATKYANGGLINGNSHDQGGVMINAEGGEGMINKRSMKVPAFRQLASAINVAGGGVSFAPNKSQNENSIITATISRTDVSDVVRSIPVTVTERDISKTQRKVRTIESRSKY